MFWGPTRQEFYTPHPLYTPPTPGNLFSGVRGLGVHKIWSRNIAQEAQEDHCGKFCEVGVLLSLKSEKSGCPQNWVCHPLPTPKSAQNEGRLYKSVENPQNWHFLCGGTQFYGQNDVMDIWAFLRSHLGTLALKTEDFSRKIRRFSKTQKWIY